MLACGSRLRLPIVRFTRSLHHTRRFHVASTRLNVAQTYLDKLQKRAEEEGISVDQLKTRVKQSTRPEPLPEARTLQKQAKPFVGNSKANDGVSWKANERKDKSPVKPLAEIMDVHKVLRKQHTVEQISALWTAFHASRSGGTGRGFLSATVPLETYETLIKNGKKFPSFLMPLMRESSQTTENDAARKEPSYEFFFMQWGLHPASPIPAPSVLDAPLPDAALPPAPVHPLATVLFTPLLEYKTRTSFATPHLVLTMYPELSQSHKVVLLRGELTPSPSGAGRYLLSQQDAQLLALGLQRFYLIDCDGKDSEGIRKERAELLRVFNERPSEFNWEDLLKHADPTS